MHVGITSRPWSPLHPPITFRPTSTHLHAPPYYATPHITRMHCTQLHAGMHARAPPARPDLDLALRRARHLDHRPQRLPGQPAKAAAVGGQRHAGHGELHHRLHEQGAPPAAVGRRGLCVAQLQPALGRLLRLRGHAWSAGLCLHWDGLCARENPLSGPLHMHTLARCTDDKGTCLRLSAKKQRQRHVGACTAPCWSHGAHYHHVNAPAPV